MRAARHVKPLSLETRQKLEKRPVYSRSMASIIMVPSVEFFRVVYANCYIGNIEWSRRHVFQLLREGLVQSP